MSPNYGYQLYQAERTQTRAEVLAGDAWRGHGAAASRRGRAVTSAVTPAPPAQAATAG
ncbi:MAG TPA: hypothetical protein VH641_20655 [Streptosporangiaceae bacterium]|jgi:hypothetical protein